MGEWHRLQLRQTTQIAYIICHLPYIISYTVGLSCLHVGGMLNGLSVAHLPWKIHPLLRRAQCLIACTLLSSTSQRNTWLLRCRRQAFKIARKSSMPHHTELGRLAWLYPTLHYFFPSPLFCCMLWAVPSAWVLSPVWLSPCTLLLFQELTPPVTKVF